MEIETITFSPMFANSYLAIEGKEAILFDPGLNYTHRLEEYIYSRGYKLLGIFVTHGHFDHFSGLKEWDKDSLPPVFFPKDDLDALQDPYKNVSATLFDSPETLELSPYPLEDEDEIRLGNFFIKVIATPYHTSGSCCFYLPDANALISGDALFKGGYGRTDLPSGNPEQRADSLMKLSKLPENTVVYPGHGPKTTIKNEFFH